MNQNAFNGLDIAVIGACFSLILVAGLRQLDRGGDARRHFLASTSAAWPRIGLALYGSTLGAVSLVGLTGTAYAHGIAVFAYEWMAALVLPLFCMLILPTYLKSGVYTVPEFLERRFGRFVRSYVAALSICIDIFLGGGGGLFAGAILFQLLVPSLPLWQTAIILAGLSGAFLLLGGLRAVILIEAIQGIVILPACACLAWFTIRAAGGLDRMFSQIDPTKLHLIMPASDPDMPWTGLVTGVPLIGFYFWCTNQSMVQRVLAARSVEDGRGGSLLGGLLKLTTLFTVVLPGVAAVLVFPHLQAPDEAFSHIVFRLLPHGVVGAIVAICLVSILSNLASLYNSAATVLTMDLIRQLRPGLADRQLILVGRILVIVLMVASVLLAQQISHFHNTLWQYLQAVNCYFVPPVAAVFLAGFLTTRANATGAVWALAAGTATGLACFFGIEVFRIVPLHFQLAAVVVFGVAIAGVSIGSLFGPREPLERIRPLTFTSDVWRAETMRLQGVPLHKNYRVLSLLLIGATLALVFSFR